MFVLQPEEAHTIDTLASAALAVRDAGDIASALTLTKFLVDVVQAYANPTANEVA